jgi:uncharacterized protein YecT (DUF1311 family)
MKKYLKFVILMLSLGFGLAAAECKTDCVIKNRSQAQDCPLDMAPLTRCENYSGYMKEDKKLNKEYKELVKVLDKDNVVALRKTQRSWLDWRIDKCDEVDEQAKCDNGVCAGVAHDECIVALTIQRTNELSRFKQNLQDARSSGFIFLKNYDY